MLTINNTLDGYLKDVEIKGNTIQDIENLADIRSVGEKVEGQELYEIPVLSRGKNLINEASIILGEGVTPSNGQFVTDATRKRTDYIKFNSNTNYVMTNAGCILFYDANKQYIGYNNSTLKGVSPSNCAYVVIRMGIDATNIQLEEGTVATEYEPYQEDKITILSPTPLEKVGDVADRIICKDGVWGVEKNIMTKNINSKEYSIATTVLEPGGSRRMLFALPNAKDTNSETPISNFNTIPYTNSWDTKVDAVSFGLDGKSFLVYLFIEDYTVDKYIKKLDNLNIITKYPTTTPQFIPLPHSQQVKLRTFANKTNISFLTEIEGTIKAQVPKSLGATVNTHTTQISNLNKELDRVKKLEESTVSTVETESDFTTVEATSNGYFEDVTLEGKTLVNLFKFDAKSTETDSYIKVNVVGSLSKIVLGKIYTVANLSSRNINIVTSNAQGGWANEFTLKKNSVAKISTCNDYVTSLMLYKSEGWVVGDASFDKIGKQLLILEGDHTQNPPSYFEGLKSVGQGTDEIVVSSVNENLFDKNNCSYNINDGGYYISNYININDKLYYDIYKNLNATKYVYYEFLDKNKKRIYINYNVSHPQSGIIENTCGAKYIRLQMRHNTTITKEEIDNNYGVIISSSPIKNINTPHQSDKKRLLFYNEETQTWEKPVLREWDSIEKHSDGKYYYHQRSGEVVLNGGGNEYWTNAIISSNTNTIRFALNNIYTSATNKYMGAISDKFKIVYNDGDMGADSENIGINGHANALFLTIEKSKLSSQDLTGFKQWLQANNVTVVYQLAEEKVYECTNIDLITYANETNYIVESGAIVPKTTLKVHNNISNVVSLLQKKVSLLESNMTKYMITQNRMQLASTYSADSVTFKVDYALCSEEVEYNEDLYNLILNNILVGKDNYDYDKMFTMVLDYASWNQISWEQFDILVGLMDIQHNPPIEEIPTDDEIVEEIPNEIM